MNHKTVARKLRDQLREAGVTQTVVAAAAGVVPSCVSHVLSGRLKSRNVFETARRLLREKGVAA